MSVPLRQHLKRGVDLSTQKARRVRPDDFHEFDYIIAMDSSNFEDLALNCPPQHRIETASVYGVCS